MRTIPLYGKKAAGRVALVDDGDYGLVMRYRWNCHDPEPKPGHRRTGPYAVAKGGRLRMHVLIMGIKGIDHTDHDGLNNQRSNLRTATAGQNARNIRPRLECSSRYKGVCLVRGLWRAYVDMEGRRHPLGDFASELEAAYTHDAAARELHGEFACPNFQDEPTQAMRDQWRAEREARDARIAAGADERMRAFHEACSEWWTTREPEIYICRCCGGEFQSRAVGKKFYCGQKCRIKVNSARKLEARREKRRQQLEGSLF